MTRKKKRKSRKKRRIIGEDLAFLPGSRKILCDNCRKQCVVVILEAQKRGGNFCPKCDGEIIKNYKQEGATVLRIDKAPPFLPPDTGGYLPGEVEPYKFPSCVTCRHYNSAPSKCLILGRIITKPQITRRCRHWRSKNL